MHFLFSHNKKPSNEVDYRNLISEPYRSKGTFEFAQTLRQVQQGWPLREKLMREVQINRRYHGSSRKLDAREKSAKHYDRGAAKLLCDRYYIRKYGILTYVYMRMQSIFYSSLEGVYSSHFKTAEIMNYQCLIWRASYICTVIPHEILSILHTKVKRQIKVYVEVHKTAGNATTVVLAGALFRRSNHHRLCLSFGPASSPGGDAYTTLL